MCQGVCSIRPSSQNHMYDRCRTAPLEYGIPGHSDDLFCSHSRRMLTLKMKEDSVPEPRVLPPRFCCAAAQPPSSGIPPHCFGLFKRLSRGIAVASCRRRGRPRWAHRQQQPCWHYVRSQAERRRSGRPPCPAACERCARRRARPALLGRCNATNLVRVYHIQHCPYRVEMQQQPPPPPLLRRRRYHTGTAMRTNVFTAHTTSPQYVFINRNHTNHYYCKLPSDRTERHGRPQPRPPSRTPFGTGGGVDVASYTVFGTAQHQKSPTIIDDVRN
jgi:hypothetical protein